MVRICSVIGCYNSTTKLEEWYSQLCEIHGLHFGSCVCTPPFQLFPFPTESRDPEGRKRWINLVNRKTKDGRDWQPTYQDRVCSVHFIESEPTPSLPDPTESLGYDTIDSWKFSKRKLPRDPPEESLPFRVIVEEMNDQLPKKKRRRVTKTKKKKKNKEKESHGATATDTDENNVEQTFQEKEPLSTSEETMDHCEHLSGTKQSECECPHKDRIEELERRVKTLEHLLQVAKNKLELANAMQSGVSTVPVCEDVFNVTNPDENRSLSEVIPAKAETKNHSSSVELELGEKRYQTRNKGQALRSTQQGKKECLLANCQDHP